MDHCRNIISGNFNFLFKRCLINENKGFGVHTRQWIPKDLPLIHYEGDILTRDKEIKDWVNEYACLSDINTSYMLQILLPYEVTKVLHFAIDGYPSKYEKTLGRSMNHSKTGFNFLGTPKLIDGTL